MIRAETATIGLMCGQTGYRLQATGYRLQATGYRLQATGYRLQATGYRLQATIRLNKTASLHPRSVTDVCKYPFKGEYTHA
jgi:hypothetical protein